MKNRKLGIYIILTCILALLCYILAFYFYKKGNITVNPGHLDYLSIILFIALEALSESFFIKWGPISVTTGFAVTTAAIFTLGTFWAVIVASIGISLRIINYENKYHHLFNTPIYKTLFNISNMTISTFLASFVFYNFLGHVNNSEAIELMVKFILLSFTFLFTNTVIISLLVNLLSSKDTLFKIFTNNFKLGFLNIIFIAPFGILLAYLYSRYSLLGVTVFMIPVISLRYIFKIYIQ